MENRNRNSATGGKDQRQEKQTPVSIGGNGASGRSGSVKRTTTDRDKKGHDGNDRQVSSSADDLEALQEEEVSGPAAGTTESENYSDTDEDEDEGLGDGNLGRTVRGQLE